MDIKIASNCIICGNKIKNQGVIKCLKCGQPCKMIGPKNLPELKNNEEKIFGLNVKSKCCGADIDARYIKSSCSEKCHKALIDKMILKAGEFIYEKDMNGKIRKIPTAVIVSKGGLTEGEIMTYPEVEIN